MVLKELIGRSPITPPGKIVRFDSDEHIYAEAYRRIRGLEADEDSLLSHWRVPEVFAELREILQITWGEENVQLVDLRDRAKKPEDRIVLSWNSRIWKPPFHGRGFYSDGISAQARPYTHQLEINYAEGDIVLSSVELIRSQALEEAVAYAYKNPFHISTPGIPVPILG